MIGQLALWQRGALEVLWIGAGVVGVTVASKNLRTAKRELDAIPLMNGRNLMYYRELRLLAYGHFRNNLLRLLKHAIILATAIFVALTPIYYRLPIITMGFVMIVGLLLTASILDRRQQELMFKEGEAEDD